MPPPRPDGSSEFRVGIKGRAVTTDVCAGDYRLPYLVLYTRFMSDSTDDCRTALCDATTIEAPDRIFIDGSY